MPPKSLSVLQYVLYRDTRPSLDLSHKTVGHTPSVSIISGQALPTNVRLSLFFLSFPPCSPLPCPPTDPFFQISLTPSTSAPFQTLVATPTLSSASLLPLVSLQTFPTTALYTVPPYRAWTFSPTTSNIPQTPSPIS